MKFNGAKLRALRTEKGLSADDLFVSLRNKGARLNSTSICRIETGKQEPRYNLALAIAEEFGVPVDTFNDNV
jgi:transcriptional regulator with XRE-family HTH domain